MSFLGDWPYFYPFFVLSALGCLGVGRLLLPGSLLWRQFLAGLVMISAIASSMAWSAPLFVLPFNRAAIAFGWGVLVWQAMRGQLPMPRRPGWRTVTCAALATALGLAVSLRFSFLFVSLGESPYFLGPLVEFFQADYFGPVRVAGYYPWEMTATHILSPMVLTTLASVLPKGTMLQSVELRFLLVFLPTARFTYVMLARSPLPPVLSAVVAAAGLLMIHREMDNCVNFSTFLYIMLIMEVGIAIFWDRTAAPEQTARDLLFLLAAMVAAKTAILYLPGLTFLWVAARFPRQALGPTVILASLVTVAQVLTVAGRPKPFPDIHYGFSLVNPLGGRPGLDYYPNVGDALISQDNVMLLFQQHYAVGIFAILAMVAVKFWLLPIMATDRLTAADPSRREIYRVAEVFLMVLVTGWVLVRHDQHGITHQTWITFGSTPLILAAILTRALASDGRWWRIGLVATAAATLALGYDPWSTLESPASAHLGGVTPMELARMSDAEALERRPGEEDSDYCVRSLLHGHRVSSEDVKASCMGSFAVKPVSGK